MKAATTGVVSKQQLGRESLKTWDEFKEQVTEKSSYLLRIGAKEGNSRMKFLAKVLTQLTEAKLNVVVKDIADQDRALKTEEKMEHVKDSEKQLTNVNELWKLINKFKNEVSASNDPYLKLRYTSICEVVSLYQSGELCYKHKNHFDAINQYVTILRNNYYYQKNPVVKKKKTELQPIPHEAVLA